jgi:hypothetical protein
MRKTNETETRETETEPFELVTVIGEYDPLPELVGLVAQLTDKISALESGKSEAVLTGHRIAGQRDTALTVARQALVERDELRGTVSASAAALRQANEGG